MNTKERLETALIRIGWSLKDEQYGKYRPVDHNGRRSLWVFTGRELRHITPDTTTQETSYIDLRRRDSITLIQEIGVRCGTKTNHVLTTYSLKAPSFNEKGEIKTLFTFNCCSTQRVFTAAKGAIFFRIGMINSFWFRSS